MLRLSLTWVKIQINVPYTRGPRMRTLAKGMGINWCLKQQRWLTPRECWATLGHLVSPELVDAMRGARSPFSVGHAAPRERSRRSQLSERGNAMHLNAIGGVILLIMLKLERLGSHRLDSASSSCAKELSEFALALRQLDK